MKKFLLSVTSILAFGAVNSQMYLATDSVDFAAWTFMDLDADTHNWTANDWTGSGGFYDPAGGAMNSYSYDNGTSSALTPDNLAISPIIDMSATVAGSLSWEAGNGETTASGWYEEHYAVYIVTDLVPILAGTYPTPVFEQTLLAGATLYSENVDITALVTGQATVYVIFRHFMCTDEFTLMIDNVRVDGSVTGTDDNDLHMSIYPNPAVDVLNITLNQPVETVSIYSLDGQLIISELVNSNILAIDVVDLAPGVYLYEVSTTEGMRSKSTFVKK